MKNSLMLVFFFLCSNLFGQTYNPSNQTWIINAETAPCGDIDGNECLLYKSQGKKEFEVLNDKIEGFDYQKGFTYTISVKQEIKQPPIAAGESVFKYVLVKIISKKEKKEITEYPSNISSTSSISTIEVNFETVACEEDNSKSCLLIREKGKKEFEILNSTINGFDYQPGYSYVLSIVEDKTGNYFLLKEISKKFVQSSTTKYQPLIKSSSPTISTTTTSTGKIIGKTNIQTSSSLDRKWYLRKMKEAESSSFVTDDNIMWIEINTFNNQLKGFGACNKFEAVLRTDQSSTFQLDKLTSGYINCGNKKMENLFYDLLQQSDGFEIKNGNLILSKRWNYLLEFVSNPDNKEEINSTYTPPTIVKNDQSTYATNQNINSTQDIYVPAVVTSTKNETTTSSVTTTKTDEQQQPVSATVSNKESTISGDAEAEEMQRKIDEIQKALTAKKQKAADDALKAEEAKLALAKETEIKKKEELKLQQQKAAEQEKLATAKAEKLKEYERIKKELEEMDNGQTNSSTTSKPSETTTTSNTKTENTKPTQKPFSVTTPKNTVNTSGNNPQLDVENVVYYLKGNSPAILDRTTCIYKGSAKNNYLEMPTNESVLQYHQSKIPKLLVRFADDVNPDDFMHLHICDFKKDIRIINLTPKKNILDISFKKIEGNLYEIIMPENLAVNEYAFITNADYDKLNDATFNSTTAKLNCFGVNEVEQVINSNKKETTENNSYDKSKSKENSTVLMPKKTYSKKIPEPEYENTPYFYDELKNELVDLDADQYVQGARPKGMYGSETALYINGTTSNVKIEKEDAAFIIKINSNIDPRTTIDLTAMVVNKKSGKREAVIFKRGAFTAEGVNNVINLSIHKLGDGIYIISPKEMLNSGEYFISIAGNAKIVYSFSIN